MNAWEGLFGNLLRTGSTSETISWFNVNYPMNDMRRRAVRDHGKKLIVGKSYRITHRDRATVNPETTTDVIRSSRKYVFAYCNLRNAMRTLKRGSIESLSVV